MKTLVLVRHAKSSWDHDIADIERSLSSRGYGDANLLSKEFLKYNFVPDALFSSPANRAVTTCKIFIDNCNYQSNQLKIIQDLYDFGGRQVANFIDTLGDENQNVMIFGHNHAFTAIANSFGDIYIDNVPTCGLVMIQFNIDSWKNLDKGHTKLTLFPKELKS